MQYFLYDFEQFLILHDEFFSKYPAFGWGIVFSLLIIAFIDGLRAYLFRKRLRVYYCCGDEGDICTCKFIYSKKLHSDLIIPEIYQEDFALDSLTKKNLKIGGKKNENV